MGEFKVQKLGVMMQPEEGNANEIEGVLNPAAVRGKDGNLYLFPRLVAKGNYSRIGVARVVFNEAGDPTGVERLGIALEPEADYELRPDGGGCEDPRISFVEPLDHYVMTYVAFGAKGPRIAVARSNDLLKWERVGLATFTPYKGLEFDGIDNKDSCVLVKRYHAHREVWSWVYYTGRCFPEHRRKNCRKMARVIRMNMTIKKVYGYHTCLLISKIICRLRMPGLLLIFTLQNRSTNGKN